LSLRREIQLELIDTVIQKWTAHGYNVSFRITCKETGGLVFATPEWVKNAGAKGTFRPETKAKNWEPDYGDPVFLRNLRNSTKHSHKDMRINLA